MDRLNILLKRIESGIEEQNAKRNVYVVKEVISFTDEESGSEILIMPSDHYCVTTMVDFGTKILGTQNANMKQISILKQKSPMHERLVFYMK